MKTKGLADGGVGPGFKAALGQLLTRLKKDAVLGVVPERVFLDRVSGLGVVLTDGQLRGLRAELSRQGLRVGQERGPTKEDSAVARKVVQDSNFAGADVVRGLLDRYRDRRGRVSDLALEGVFRLAGLNEREARALWAGERGKAPFPGVSSPTTAEPTPVRVAAEHVLAPRPATVPAGAEDPGAKPGEAPVGEGRDRIRSSDIDAAVAAAREVMDKDRRTPRPEERILTAEQEVGLGVLLRGGADRVAVEPKETELAKLPRDDERRLAYECLVLHNQKLVHKNVRAYLGQGLDYDDLFQHGMRGVMRAAVKYDLRKGYKFSTYATQWIRQAVTRAVMDEGTVIRVPVHMHEAMRKVANAERDRARRGLPTRNSDLAVACDLTLTKVEEIRRISLRTDSLDRVLLDGATLGEFVARTHTVQSVERQVLLQVLHEDVMEVVDTFPEREARILVRRLGLDGDDISTLDELGGEFGISRERIRQLFNKEHPVFLERLREAGVIGDGQEQGDREVLLQQEADRLRERARDEGWRLGQKQASLLLKEVREQAERKVRAAEARARAAEARAAAPTVRDETGDTDARVSSLRSELESVQAELEALRRAVAEKEDPTVAEVAQRAFVAQTKAGAQARAERAEAEAQTRAARAEAEARTRLAQVEADAQARVATAEERARAAGAQAEVQVRATRAEAEAAASRTDALAAEVQIARANAQAAEAELETLRRRIATRVEAPVAGAEERARAALAEAEERLARVEERALAVRTQALTAQAEADRARAAAAAGDRRLELAGARHRMHTALLRREHQLRLTAVAAGRQQAVDAEVRLWERAFLDRMDRALAHGEQSLRAEFAQRLEQMTKAHRETEAILLRRAQRAEAELVTAEAQSADTVHARREAAEARRQLQEHLAECGQRTAGLEQRLRHAETSFAQQHRYTRELEQSLVLRQGEAQQAREGEQRLMERLAQSEWAFRAQIDQLRVQLDAARTDAENRRTLRDRWRRD